MPQWIDNGNRKRAIAAIRAAKPYTAGIAPAPATATSPPAQLTSGVLIPNTTGDDGRPLYEEALTAAMVQAWSLWPAQKTWAVIYSQSQPTPTSAPLYQWLYAETAGTFTSQT